MSLLPIVSKLFEKVIHRQLLDHFTMNILLRIVNVVSDPNLSTEHAALYLYNNISHRLDLIFFMFLLICLKLSILPTTPNIKVLYHKK